MEEPRMDHPVEETTPAQPEKPHYVPRPAWQVWAARVALAIFLLGLILYYLNVFRGGL